MNKDATLYETNQYRCLDYYEKQTDDIYLTFCGIETCLPGYEFDCKNRDGYHLHVILSGKGILSVNGVEQQLHYGQMFVTKAGEETWYRADEIDPWTYCWMTFDGNNAPEYLNRMGLSEGVNSRNCNSDPTQFYTYVKDILDHPEMKPANDVRHLSLLLAFLALAIATVENDPKNMHHESEYNADVYVEKAESYIRFNFSKVKINDVARNIGINRSYLAKIFKNKKGISPQASFILILVEEPLPELSPGSKLILLNSL